MPAIMSEGRQEQNSQRNSLGEFKSEVFQPFHQLHCSHCYGRFPEGQLFKHIHSLSPFVPLECFDCNDTLSNPDEFSNHVSCWHNEATRHAGRQHEFARCDYCLFVLCDAEAKKDHEHRVHIVPHAFGSGVPGVAATSSFQASTTASTSLITFPRRTFPCTASAQESSGLSPVVGTGNFNAFSSLMRRSGPELSGHNDGDVPQRRAVSDLNLSASNIINIEATTTRRRPRAPSSSSSSSSSEDSVCTKLKRLQRNNFGRPPVVSSNVRPSSIRHPAASKIRQTPRRAPLKKAAVAKVGARQRGPAQMPQLAYRTATAGVQCQSLPRSSAAVTTTLCTGTLQTTAAPVPTTPTRTALNKPTKCSSAAHKLVCTLCPAGERLQYVRHGQCRNHVRLRHNIPDNLADNYVEEVVQEINAIVSRDEISPNGKVIGVGCQTDAVTHCAQCSKYAQEVQQLKQKMAVLQNAMRTINSALSD